MRKATKNEITDTTAQALWSWVCCLDLNDQDHRVRVVDGLSLQALCRLTFIKGDSAPKRTASPCAAKTSS